MAGSGGGSRGGGFSGGSRGGGGGFGGGGFFGGVIIVLAFFAPATVAAHIMEDINRIHGMLSDANGIVMALPVDKAYKI